MKNYIATLFAAIACISQAYARIPHNDEGGLLKKPGLSFVVMGSYSYGIYGSKSFREFTDGYNNYLASVGQTPAAGEMKPLRYAQGFDFIYGIGTRKLGFLCLSYSQVKAHTSLKFDDGTRHFEMKTIGHIHPGYYRTNGVTSLYYSIGFAAPIMKSYWEYPDGAISYERDHELNGVYSSVALMQKLQVGLHLNAGKFAAVELLLGVMRMGFGSDYYNADYAKFLDGNGSSSLMFWLPTNLTEYYQNLSGYDITKSVRPNCWAFNLTLRAGFPSNKKTD